MNKRPLIGISILTVALLVLGSLSNVVGYLTVQSSFQVVENNDGDSRERIFHTIGVLANNHEVQTALFEFNMKRARFLMKDFLFVFPVIITDQDLDVAYRVGSLLIKVIGKTRIMSVMNRSVMMDGVEKVLSVVIDQNSSLRAEVSGLSNLRSTCECDESLWIIPPIGLCIVLFIFSILNAFLYDLTDSLSLLFNDLYHTSYFYVFLVCLFLSRIFSRFASVFYEISEIAWDLLIDFECIDPWPWPLENR